MRLPIVVGLCVSVASVLLFVVTSRSPEAPLVEASNAPGRTSVESEEQPARAASIEQWAARDTSSVSGVRQAFERQESLAEFFQAALLTPERGGLYYAKLAYGNCAAIKAMLRKPDLSTEAKTGLEAERKRCDYVGDPASYERLKGTLATSAAERDPLFSLSRHFTGFQPKRPENAWNDLAVRAAQRAIDLGDPYLLGDALYRMVEATRTFDGEPVSTGQRNLLHSASTIAQCDLGLDCDRSPAVLIACGQDDCGSSLVTLTLQRQGGPATDAKRRAVLQMAEKIVSGARSGRLSSLFDLSGA